MKLYGSGALLVAIALTFASSTVSPVVLAGEKGAVRKVGSLRRGETRPTLDPGLFSDFRVKTAYRIAKDIPQVLDSIYCYCMCEESPAFRHKSLLSCYVDNHAAA